jgi:hypothetical protein
MLVSHQLPDLVLLCLLYPKHAGPCTALSTRRRCLAEYNLQLSRIACIMGDNAPFNAAVAKYLDLPLGKCLPHSLNLVVKAALKPFKGVHAGARGAERHHPRRWLGATPQVAEGAWSERAPDGRVPESVCLGAAGRRVPPRQL